MAWTIEPILFVMVLAVAFAVAHVKDLFAAAMLTGVFSLLCAGIYLMMDAVDVAFTEAAVGAGISTVLVLGTLSLTANTERQQAFRPMPVVVVILTGGALLYGMLDMAAYGDPMGPIHAYDAVSPAYIRGTMENFHIPNIVTAVLGSYRGYDTFGETTVVFTAAVGVMLLLGSRKEKPDTIRRDIDATEFALRPIEAPEELSPRRPMGMREMVVLRLVAKAFIPLIMLFALYVQFHGDFGPGGGFQAGVIFAAGLILYGLIYGLAAVKRVAPPELMERLIALGVLLYGGVGIVSLLMGGSFLDYSVLNHHSPAHGQHLGLLLIEGGVGLAVAATMTTIYYYVAGRGLVLEERS